MPQIQVNSAINSGKLLDIAPGHTIDVPLEWHAWNLDTPFTRALSEQVVTTARRHLVQE